METFLNTSAENKVPTGYYEINLSFAIVWSLISFFGIAGNIVNLIILPRLQVAGGTKIFLIALSLTDLSTAICIITAVIVSRIGWEDSHAWDIVCQTYSVLGRWASMTSAAFIFVVNLDRFLHVVRPFKYHDIINEKRAMFSTIMVALVMLVSLLLSIGMSEKSFDTFSFQRNHLIFISYTTTYEAVVFTLCLWLIQAVVIAMYARIFCIVRRHAKIITAQETAAVRLKTVSATINTTSQTNLSGQYSQPQEGPKTSKDDPSTCPFNFPNGEASASGLPSRNNFKMEEQRENGKGCKLKKQMKNLHQNSRNLRTTCLVTGSYLMAWTPFSILIVNAVFSGKLPNDVILLITYTMGIGNCCVNCCVYMFLRSDFKAALRKKIRWR